MVQDVLNTVNLVRCRREDLGLDEVVALAAAGGDRVVGMVYAPRRAAWVEIVGGALQAGPGEAIPDGIFEARLFDGVREWRWLHRASGRGTAVVLAEGEAPAGCTGWETRTLPDATPVERRLLLWGTSSAASAGGWATLQSPRTGPMAVPVEGLREGQGAAIEALIYLCVRDEDGNDGVFEERMARLAASAVSR